MQKAEENAAEKSRAVKATLNAELRYRPKLGVTCIVKVCDVCGITVGRFAGFLWPFHLLRGGLVSYEAQPPRTIILASCAIIL